MGEHRRAVLGDVLVDQDSRLGIPQKPCQGSFAVEERKIAKIPRPSCSIRSKAYSIALCEASRRRSSSKSDNPSGPSTTASPSIMKLLALIRPAAAAIAGSRTVQSLALRV
jgi:hypothetical protein